MTDEQRQRVSAWIAQGAKLAEVQARLASELGIIEKSGAWYSFGGERIGQGRENAKAYLDQHQDVMDRIESMVLAKHGIQRAGAPSVTPSEGNGAGHHIVEEKVVRKSAAASKN